MKIYTLHGFLGRPSDWNLPDAVDLFQRPIVPFDEWAQQFNASALPGSVVIGYSLGGRLAMHALIQNPTHWKAAVIISAHPGLKEEERAERIASDQRWAKRFLNDPWEKLMTDWNKQPVFAGQSLPRKESDFDRTVLCQVLEKWSLGRQAQLLPAINALPLPIFWITGELDPHAARGLKLAHPQSKQWVAPGAGHRVPWESGFQEQITQFLGEIE